MDAARSRKEGTHQFGVTDAHSSLVHVEFRELDLELSGACCLFARDLGADGCPDGDGLVAHLYHLNGRWGIVSGV